MTKFTIALREIGTYKEVLRSQVKFPVVSQFSVIVAILFRMLYCSTPYSRQKAAPVAFQEMISKSIQYYPFLWVCFPGLLSRPVSP